MHYTLNTPEQQAQMLAAIGVETVDELFADIPEAMRLKGGLGLPRGLSEPELLRLLHTLAVANERLVCFAGAGAYCHYRPAVIPHLVGLGEFLTAYTPYQPEIAQGTLAAIFEFQSHVCRLSGMDVANASMYDGASALAEAALMAVRAKNRKKILISRGVHPDYRKVVATYMNAAGIELVEVPLSADGITDLERAHCDGDTAALITQSPNYFGRIEGFQAAAELAHAAGAFAVACVVEGSALGLLKTPGEQGSDIFVGEGQAFGIPMQFGGPHLGLLAVKTPLMRKIPGRLVGRAKDAQGRDGFVLTLQAREQHIRRDKATSNICTNQGLNALIATIYLSLVGPQLQTVARQSHAMSEYLKTQVTAIPGIGALFEGPTYNEFAVQVPDPGKVRHLLAAQGFLAGVTTGDDYPEFKDGLLLCATENNTKAECDALATALTAALKGGMA